MCVHVYVNITFVCVCLHPVGTGLEPLAPLRSESSTVSGEGLIKVLL